MVQTCPVVEWLGIQVVWFHRYQNDGPPFEYRTLLLSGIQMNPVFGYSDGYCIVILIIANIFTQCKVLLQAEFYDQIGFGSRCLTDQISLNT